jgi:hypothetical protein
VRLFDKLGLSQPCPRCNAQASLDRYHLSMPVRLLAILALIASMALGRTSPGWWQVGQPIVNMFCVVTLLFAERVQCNSCHQSLSRVIGGGWR